MTIGLVVFVALGVVALVCGFVVAFRWPLALIVGSIAAVPLELAGVSVVGITITPSEALLLLGAGGWTAREIGQGRIPYARSRLTAPLLFLVASIPLGIFVAVDFASLFKIFLMWTAFLIVFFAIIRDGNLGTVRAILLAVTFAGAATAVVAIVESGGGADQQFQGTGFTIEGRAAGPFTHPNTLAAFLGLGLASSLGVLGGGRSKWEHVFGGVSAPLVAFGLALTVSRGGILAATVVLVVLLAWQPVRRFTLAVGVAVLILVGAGLAPASARTTGNVVERMKSLSNIQEQTGELRPFIWSRSVQMIGSNPLVGVGTGQFVYEAPKYGLIEYGQGGYTHAIPHGHDFLLTIAAERGVAAGLAFVWFATALLVLMVRTVRSASSMLKRVAFPVVAALGSLLTTALFDYDIGNNVVAAMLFVFAAALVVVARETNEVQSSVPL